MKKRILWLGLSFLLVAVLVLSSCGTGVLTEEQEAEIDDIVSQYADSLKGADGEMGPQGPAGVKGDTGGSGSSSTGLTGAKGDAGASGSVGEAGPQGPAGEPGVAGVAGIEGLPGSVGSRGASGPAGSVVTPLFTASLEAKLLGLSLTSSAMAKSGVYSVNLAVPSNSYGFANADEARFILTPIKPITLGQINTIAWQEYLTTGSPPHVDVMVVTATGTQESIVIQYAYNGGSHYLTEAPAPYGALTGGWYAVFNDDGNGPAVIDDTAFGWLSSGAAGPYPVTVPMGAFIGGSLAQWKAGSVVTGISADSQVDNITIEIDNWGGYPVNAYLDQVAVNGVMVWE